MFLYFIIFAYGISAIQLLAASKVTEFFHVVSVSLLCAFDFESQSISLAFLNRQSSTTNHLLFHACNRSKEK